MKLPSLVVLAAAVITVLPTTEATCYGNSLNWCFATANYYSDYWVRENRRDECCWSCQDATPQSCYYYWYSYGTSAVTGPKLG
jgi:hypothetical protein